MYLKYRLRNGGSFVSQGVIQDIRRMVDVSDPINIRTWCPIFCKRHFRKLFDEWKKFFFTFHLISGPMDNQ